MVPQGASLVTNKGATGLDGLGNWRMLPNPIWCRNLLRSNCTVTIPSLLSEQCYLGNCLGLLFVYCMLYGSTHKAGGGAIGTIQPMVSPNPRKKVFTDKYPMCVASWSKSYTTPVLSFSASVPALSCDSQLQVHMDFCAWLYNFRETYKSAGKAGCKKLF